MDIGPLSPNVFAPLQSNLTNFPNNPGVSFAQNNPQIPNVTQNYDTNGNPIIGERLIDGTNIIHGIGN